MINNYRGLSPVVYFLFKLTPKVHIMYLRYDEQQKILGELVSLQGNLFKSKTYLSLGGYMNNVTTCDTFLGFTEEGHYVMINRNENGKNHLILIPVAEKERRRLMAS